MKRSSIFAVLAASTSPLIVTSLASGALIFWTGTDGSFHNQGNWGSAVPGPIDTAVFSDVFAGSKDITVSFSSDVTNEAVAVGDLSLALDLAGNTYTVTQAITTLNADLMITGGTLSAMTASFESSYVFVADDAAFTTNTAVFGTAADSSSQIDVEGTFESMLSIILGSAGTGEMNIGHDGAASTGAGGEVSTASLVMGASSGGEGTVNIGEDATLTTGTATLGAGSGSSATVNIGDGGTWINESALSVGALGGSGGSGTIAVEDGGQLRTAGLNIGNNGLITQDASGSIVMGDTSIDLSDLPASVRNRINGGGLYVGNDGLAILNGGELQASRGFIDGLVAGERASMTVNGNGSNLDLDGELIVGIFREGSLFITGGGSVNSGDVLIGERSSGQGSITVSGQDGGGNASLLNVTGQLDVGGAGQAELNIFGGGAVTTTGNATVGATQGGSGNVMIAGAGANGIASQLDIGGDLTLGYGNSPTNQNNINATLTVQSGGRVIVDQGTGLLQVNGSGLLTGSGIVNGNVQLIGRLRPGFATETITITGNLATQAGSIVSINYSDEPLDLASAFPNLDASLVGDVLTSSVIAVQGQATLADGTVVQIVKLTGNASPGDAFIMLHAELGGMDTNNPPDLEVSDTFLVHWVPQVVQDLGQQYLIMTAQVDEPGLDDLLTSLTGNSRQVADALVGGELYSVLTELDPDDPEAGLQTLLPLQHSSNAMQSLRTSRHFHSSLLYELAALRTGARSDDIFAPESPRMFGSSSVDRAAMARAMTALEKAGQPLALGMLEQRTGTWGGYLSGMGSWDRVDSKRDRAGYSAQITGVHGGVHHHFSRDVLVGLGAGYIWSELDYRDGLGESEVDTIRVGPYASWTPAGGNFFLDASATYGYHRNDVDRETIVGSASSRYDAYDISAVGQAGYDFVFGEQTVLTPLLSMEYTTLRVDSFRERGAGAADLSVDANSLDSLRLRIGASLSHVFEFPDLTMVPELYAGWSYEFLDRDMELDSRFRAGGPAFSTRAAGFDRDSLHIGAGFTAMAGTYMTLYVRYEGEFQSSHTSHGIVGGLDIRF